MEIGGGCGIDDGWRVEIGGGGGLDDGWRWWRSMVGGDWDPK